MGALRTCCGYPHGSISVYSMILGIASYLLALSSSWGCYFATVDFVLLNTSPIQFGNVGSMNMGLFSFEDKAATSDLTCKLFSSAQLESFDVWFQVARIFGILANIFIGVGMICLISLSCLLVKKWVINLLAFILLLGGVCQGMTFFFYASDAVCQDCQIFFGSGLAILSTLVTLANSIVTYQMPGAPHDDDYYDDHDFPFDVEAVRKKGRETPKSELRKQEKSVEENMPATSSSDEDDLDLNVHAPTDEQDDDDEEPNNITNEPSPRNSPRVSSQRPSDSRRQIIKTIVNQDGSRTVEETTVRGGDILVTAMKDKMERSKKSRRSSKSRSRYS